MAYDVRDARLKTYRFPRVVVGCIRCKRRGEYATARLRERFPDQTMGELAVSIAATGGCLSAQAPHGHCSAYPSEPNVEHWANLMDAYQGGWRLMLRCERNREGLKSAQPCPDVSEISIVTLKASFYWATPLERLRHKLHCPKCESRMFSLQWMVPDPVEPAGPREHHDFLVAGNLGRKG